MSDEIAAALDGVAASVAALANEVNGLKEIETQLTAALERANRIAVAGSGG